MFLHSLLSKTCFSSFDLLNIERHLGTHALQLHCKVLEMISLQKQSVSPLQTQYGILDRIICFS